MPKLKLTAIEELRESLDDPRWSMELYLLGRALVELSDKLDEHVHDADGGAIHA